MKRLWIGPLIGFIVGFVLVDDEIGLMFLAGVGLGLTALFTQFMIQYGIISILKKNHPFLKAERGFMPSLLMLAAEIVKIDGKISPSEIDHIKALLQSDFKPKKAAKFHALFLNYLDSPQDIRPICKFINYDYDNYMKTHLMYFLVSIITADGILSQIELALLKQITKRCDISISTLTQTLKQFKFKREQTYEEQSRRKPNQTKPISGSRKLANAYALLNLSSSASIEGIKKTFRKLAKLHHPDKVAHLGEAHQRKANEQFQLILAAYETIKAKKGFN